MIVSFGSLNADLIFRMERTPAAGQTLLADSLSVEAGGKGANQAVAALRDGAAVAMVGAVGRDALAAIALRNLRADGADLSSLRELDDAPTGCASILTDREGRNQIAVALGANARVETSILADVLPRAKILLLQMEAPVAEVERAIAMAAEAGVPAILNLAPAGRISRTALKALRLLVVNEDEAEQLGSWIGAAPDARSLGEALGIEIVRTLGGEGSEAWSGGRLLRVPAHPVEAVDTTAAGDCFVGVLASALARGDDLEAAMRRATVAAALACTRAGSQGSLPRAAETDAALRSRG